MTLALSANETICQGESSGSSSPQSPARMTHRYDAVMRFKYSLFFRMKFYFGATSEGSGLAAVGADESVHHQPDRRQPQRSMAVLRSRAELARARRRWMRE